MRPKILYRITVSVCQAVHFWPLKPPYPLETQMFITILSQESLSNLDPSSTEIPRHADLFLKMIKELKICLSWKSAVSSLIPTQDLPWAQDLLRAEDLSWTQDLPLAKICFKICFRLQIYLELKIWSTVVPNSKFFLRQISIMWKYLMHFSCPWRSSNGLKFLQTWFRECGN